MYVVEIKKSIATTGKFEGHITTFVKVAERDSKVLKVKMSVYDILENIEMHGANHIVIYGGDPLKQPDMQELIKELLWNDYYVNMVIKGRLEALPKVLESYTFRGSRLSYTVQCRVTHKLCEYGISFSFIDLINSLCESDILEFVVTTKEMDENVYVMGGIKKVLDEVKHDIGVQLSLAWRYDVPNRIYYYRNLSHELLIHGMDNVKLNMPVMTHWDV